MEDDASIFLDGKTLANLRVVDLKLELEKRGLSKSGSKKDLVKRLKQQLEFEKLCGERKSTGDCDLKLELDADTEQNEFVQQYLAQQQKIYAEQKEAKRKLEEIQKSGDEKESCDSTKGDDDKTEDESDTETKNQTPDKVPNDSSISSPPNKPTKDESEDTFEATNSTQPSVHKDEHPTEVKNSRKNRKISIQDDSSDETPTPKAEARDIEKDREKELSTAISSLLSVETSVKDCVDHEGISITADVDGGVPRTTHDDDREKDLATAVLSSLLVDQDDVETEAKVHHSVEDKVGHTVESEAKVHHSEEDKVGHTVESEATIDVEMESKVQQDMETEAKVGDRVGTEAKVDNSVEIKAKVNHTIERDAKANQDIETEAKVDPKVETEAKIEHNVEAKKNQNVETEVIVDLSVETMNQDNETEAKVDHVETNIKVDLPVESQVIVADTCSDVDRKPSQPGSVFTKTSSDVGKTCEKSMENYSVEDDERAMSVKDGNQPSVNVESPLEIQNPPVEPSKITQAVQEEITSKMDVSSVPYSLSEIQLPESPVNIVKPPGKSQLENESSKNAESDEDVQSNNINSKTNNKIKEPESGDINGKDTKSSNKDKNSEIETSSKKEPIIDKSHREKASKVDSAKRSKAEQSDSDNSSDEEKSRLDSKKGRGRRKKHDSSDDNRSPVKSSSRSKRKERRNRSPSSDEDKRSRDRSRSPKTSKSSRRDRNRSSEKDYHSRSKSKRGSPKKSSREGRRKRDKRHKSSSSEDRSPRKSSKSGRRGRSESSEEDRPSRTRSRESPKKDTKVGLKEQGASSGDDRSSKPQVRESPEKEAKESHRERSVTPEKAQLEISDIQKGDVAASPRNLRQSPDREQSQSKDSPKKDSRTSHKEKGRGNEQDSGSSSTSESTPEKSCDKIEKAVTKDTKRKFSEGADDESGENDSPVKKPRSIPIDEEPKPEDKMDCTSPQPEPTRRSRRNRSPKPSEGSRQNKSSSRSRSPAGKTSVDDSAVDRPSKRPPSPKEACTPSSSDSSPEKRDVKASPEKMSKKARRTSRSDSSSEKEDGRASSERMSKIARRPDSPEKKDSKSSPERMPKVVKKDVSDGELTSSGESSPVIGARETLSKWGPRKDSSSNLSKFGTMTVIRKEAPKQRLKIKRDNVIVVKKEILPESVDEDKKESEAVVEKVKDAENILKKGKELETVPEESRGLSEASVVEPPEPTEDQKLEPGECPDVPVSTTYVSRKITLANRKRTESTEEPSNKRSKWGSFAASRKAKQTTVSISTGSLKNWFPDFKLLKEPEVVPEEPPSPLKETQDIEMTPVEKDVEEQPRPIFAVTRKSERLEPPPLEVDPKSAAEGSVQLEGNMEPSRILFVRNLVRPFTLLQLKELLRETGNTLEDGFWIDKIKSKCFVTYETEEEAIKTRSVLNGARWPMSNPKILAVDFATEEDLAFHRSGAVDVKPPLAVAPSSPERMNKDEEHLRRERERDLRREQRQERMAMMPTREWDKDKLSQDPISPGKARTREAVDKDKKESKRRPNEDTPAKLLDDLFQKTKATPCIYWLPLNQEQIKERAEKLRQVNLEREQRHREREQENKRPRSKQRGRETDPRRSSSRSRSPLHRRR